MLRPANKNPPLQPKDLKKLELELPPGLRDTSFDVRHLNSVLEQSGALSVNVDAKRHKLIILGNSVSVKRAQLLAGMAFRNMGEMARIMERKAKHEETLQQLKQRLNEGHLEEFSIQPPDLMGLVIGSKGKNVQRIEKMEGILSVRVDSVKSTVSILAKSENAAKAARTQLEYVEKRFPILKRTAGRVVGTKFAYMDQIKADAGVVRIKLDDRKPAPAAAAAAAAASGDNEMIDLLIVGLKDNVDDALLLIEQHLKFLSAKSELVEDELSLNQEVRKLNLEAGMHEREMGGYARGGERGGPYAGRGGRGPRQQGQRQYNGDAPAQGQERRSKQPREPQQQQQQQQSSAVQQPAAASASAAGAAAEEQPKEGRGRGGRGRGGDKQQGDKQPQQQQQQQASQQPQQQQKQGGDRQPKQGGQQQPKQQQQQAKQQQGKQQQPQAAAAAPAAAASPVASPSGEASGAAAEGEKKNRNRRGGGAGGKKQDGAAAADPASPAAAGSPAAAAPAAAPAAGGAAAAQSKQQQQRKQGGDKPQQQQKKQADKPADAAAASSATPAAAAGAAAPAGASPKGGNNSARGPRRERQPASEVSAAGAGAAAGSPQPPAAAPAAAAPAAEKSPAPASSPAAAQ
jgi:hypothetical protein